MEVFCGRQCVPVQKHAINLKSYFYPAITMHTAVEPDRITIVFGAAIVTAAVVVALLQSKCAAHFDHFYRK